MRHSRRLPVSGSVSVSLPASAAVASGTAATAEGIALSWHLLPDGTAEIGRIDAAGTHAAVPSDTRGKVTVPASVDGYPVTALGADAFSWCPKITSVLLPETLRRIGDGAFRACLGLTALQLPASLESIGRRALPPRAELSVAEGNPNFVCTDGMLTETATAALLYVPYGRKSYSLPEGIRHLGEGLFAFNKTLTGVSLPASLRSIGIRAFDGCIGLTRITLPDGLLSIASGAFRNCPNLREISGLEGVPAVAADAFALTEH